MRQTPLIGITCRTRIVSPGVEGANSATAFLGQRELAECIVQAGGNPVLLPSVEGERYAREIVAELDGVLVGGGDDGDPAGCGEEPHPKLGFVDDVKSRFEAVLLRAALEAGVPVFGICGGHQILNVACGGTLHQDIGACTGSTMLHAVAQTEPRPCHSVKVVAGSRLHAIVGETKLRVNSTHHQAVDKVGDGLAVTARAPDETVEALERPEAPFVLSVQWHPERLIERDSASRRLFEAFVAACVDNAGARRES
ncbi:MAG: gamma-glutamyl-gamma-aminobutyrate hydrolase family protein [Verrucomicrobia bacterium]|nr:gamma-glutamyl-gamma-aminobutyrate hydrolase family protein [Verrucomicrobiota bacterium]